MENVIFYTVGLQSILVSQENNLNPAWRQQLLPDDTRSSSILLGIKVIVEASAFIGKIEPFGIGTHRAFSNYLNNRLVGSKQSIDEPLTLDDHGTSKRDS